MRKIGFIGGYDKLDFIIYIAKIFEEMGMNVLVVDASLTQKSRYIIPAVEPARMYINNYEGIDIAIGFENLAIIKQYLKVPATIDLSYDIALINLDTARAARNYEFGTYEQNYFVSTFDLYSIKKGLEIISMAKEKVHAYKVLFSKNATKEENEYLNYISKDSKVEWDEEIIYFPFENGDQSVIYYNQRMSRISLKKLSNQYKAGLMYIATKIMSDASEGMIKNALRKIEKGV